jgi:hypothetical protein
MALMAEKAAVNGASPGTNSKHFTIARGRIKSGLSVRDFPEVAPPELQGDQHSDNR